jgi:hypothetical protein
MPNLASLMAILAMGIDLVNAGSFSLKYDNFFSVHLPIAAVKQPKA